MADQVHAFRIPVGDDGQIHIPVDTERGIH
jgi:hypothetical protein